MESTSIGETKYILKSLVRSSPNEMTINKLNKDYTQTMGHQIPFRKFGFRTMEHFLYSISDTLQISGGRNPLVYVAPTEKTQHIETFKSFKRNVKIKKEVKKILPEVCNRNPIAPKLNQNVSTIKNAAVNEGIISMRQDAVHLTEEAVPDFNVDDAIFLLDFPTNTVKFGNKIKSLELPKDLKANDVFALFVTEIHNPYKFWFHIAKQNNELDDLMKELQEFYENVEKQFVMQLSNIIPGQICAAPYSGLWHRAEILGIQNNCKVKVFFIDYGTVSNVPLKCIQYLPMEFAKLNRQALRGCLSHVRPSGLRWSRDATYSFLDMVADKLLYAKITEIVRDENIVRLVLTDTNQLKDFQINNALILKGHAKLHNEKTFKVFDKLYYPTFEMLENGEYPTFHEIGTLLAQGVDYETKVYNNILCDVFAKKCSLEEYLQKLTSYHIKREN